MIAARSVKQRVVTTASAHCEAIALADMLKYCDHVHNVLSFVGIHSHIVAHQDNQSTIKLVQDGVRNTGRSRHIGMGINATKEHILTHAIKVEYTPTAAMVADLLTKPLGGAILRKHRDAVVSV